MWTFLLTAFSQTKKCQGVGVRPWPSGEPGTGVERRAARSRSFLERQLFEAFKEIPGCPWCTPELWGVGGWSQQVILLWGAGCQPGDGPNPWVSRPLEEESKFSSL